VNGLIVQEFYQSKMWCSELCRFGKGVLATVFWYMVCGLDVVDAALLNRTVKNVHLL
jgi:hypothetical protein